MSEHDLLFSRLVFGRTAHETAEQHVAAIKSIVEQAEARADALQRERDTLQARLTQVEGALRLERRTTPPSQWAVVLPVLKRLEAALIPLAPPPPKEHEEQGDTRGHGE